MSGCACPEPVVVRNERLPLLCELERAYEPAGVVGVDDTRCAWEYVAAKNVTRSVTEPGLMNSSNNRSISPTRTPLSSSASRRIAVSASSPSSRPAAASMSIPSG